MSDFWQVEQLTKALESLNAKWHGTPSGARRIITDSREIDEGDAFLALAGDNFDGHHYIDQAYKKGASLAIVRRVVDSPLPQLCVSDTRLALGRLGAYRRAYAVGLKVVALTGSSGKTTTKQLLASILSKVAPTLATKGNLNNDLGVPMTLLGLSDEHRFLVLELGANHQGEIAYTTALAKPSVACVLNVGTAHLGEFGGRDIIAKTKAEIFLGLGDDGVAVLPKADDYFDVLKQAAGNAPIITIGDRVKATQVVLSPTKSQFTLSIDGSSTQVVLPFGGVHNVQNALCAAGCAYALGVDIATIAKGLGCATSLAGRGGRIGFGVHTLIDDTYNANPEAVMAAAQTLCLNEGQKWLVLGDIGELGDRAEREHFVLGQKLATLALDQVLAVGQYTCHTVSALQACGKVAQHFASKDELLSYLLTHLNNCPTTVLFKGSRSAKMETLLHHLSTK